MDICILSINNFEVILIQTEIILCECKAEAPCTNSPTYHETHQTSFFFLFFAPSLCLLSCRQQETSRLELALQAGRDNQAELEAVLSHYAKRQAREFLDQITEKQQHE